MSSILATTNLLRMAFLILTPPYSKMKKEYHFGGPRIRVSYHSPHQVKMPVSEVRSFLSRNPSYKIEMVIYTDNTMLRVRGPRNHRALLERIPQS